MKETLVKLTMAARQTGCRRDCIAPHDMQASRWSLMKYQSWIFSRFEMLVGYSYAG